MTIYRGKFDSREIPTIIWEFISWKPLFIVIVAPGGQCFPLSVNHSTRAMSATAAASCNCLAANFNFLRISITGPSWSRSREPRSSARCERMPRWMRRTTTHSSTPRTTMRTKMNRSKFSKTIRRTLFCPPSMSSLRIYQRSMPS